MLKRFKVFLSINKCKSLIDLFKKKILTLNKVIVNLN